MSIFVSSVVFFSLVFLFLLLPPLRPLSWDDKWKFLRRELWMMNARQRKRWSTAPFSYHDYFNQISSKRMKSLDNLSLRVPFHIHFLLLHFLLFFTIHMLFHHFNFYQLVSVTSIINLFSYKYRGNTCTQSFEVPAACWLWNDLREEVRLNHYCAISFYLAFVKYIFAHSLIKMLC